MIEVTYFDRVTTPNNPHLCTIDKLFEVIRQGGKDGSVKRYIEEIRRYPNDKDTRRRLKRTNLQVITWQGKFIQRNEHASNSLTGLMCIDLDNVSPTRLLLLKTVLTQQTWIMAVFLSPSGDGYKVIIPTDNFDPDIYTNCYRQIMWWFEACFGIKPDESCHDISRGCYVSYDPNIYINLNAKIFHVEYNPDFDDKEDKASVNTPEPADNVKAPLPTDQIIPTENCAITNQGGNLSDEQILAILDRKFKRFPNNYKDGNRTHAIFAQATKLCLAGIPEQSTLIYLKQQFLPTGYDDRKLTYETNRAYVKNANKAGAERANYLDYHHYLQQKKGCQHPVPALCQQGDYSSGSDRPLTPPNDTL